ncbi:MAG: DUF4307 domain-containing protein [Actinomycetes bacterium]
MPVQEPAGPPLRRYAGRASSGRRGAVAAAVVLGVLLAAWVVWAALGAAAPEANAHVTAFRVVSDAEIDVRVTAAAGSVGRFACSVRALDGTREVVGVAAVPLDASREGGTEGWVTVRTRDRAVTATVGRCTPEN